MIDRDLDAGLAEIRDVLKALGDITPKRAAEMLRRFRRTALASAPDFQRDQEH